MTKGAAIFAAGAACGLAVGTVYGAILGFRLTKVVEKALEYYANESDVETVVGETVHQ